MLSAQNVGSRHLIRAARRFFAALRRPDPIYLGDYTILTRTAHGFKLFLDSRDVSLAPHILLDGVWEPAVTRFIDARVRPGMRVVEVGSNVGYHSLHLARRIGPRGLIACFEANPRLAQLLAQSLEVNGLKAHSLPCAFAVGDVSGQCELKVFSRHLGASSLIVNEDTAKEYHDTITRVAVPITTLDESCADWPHLDFLKIDAEGAEPLVMAGAKGLISRSPNLEILLEFGPAFWPFLEAARAFLQGWLDEGFHLQRLTPQGAVEPARIDDLLDPTRIAEIVLTRRAPPA